MKIQMYESDKLASEAAKALNLIFKGLSGKRTLFLSSGGSSLSLLKDIDPSNFGKESIIAMLDERYSDDPSVNNSLQLKNSEFGIAVLKRGANIIDSVPQNESKEELAARLEKSLREWLSNVGGTVVATVGIGPDSHVAGIMPFPEDEDFFEKTFNNNEHFVTAYDAENKNPYRLRVTTTFPLHRKIDHVVSFIKGAEKILALEKLLAEEGTLHETPARILRELKDVQIFTDQIMS